MATTILIIAAVVEVALAATRLVTHSRQTRLTSFVRIGALVVFIIAALAGIIQWGARWYLLAALLLAWAALGVWALWRVKTEAQAYRTGAVLLNMVIALALVAVAVTPDLLFPQHRPPRVTGALAVATATYTYTDASRVETFTNTGEPRRVNVEFWYPQGATGRYPLVVFSHGAFGTKGANASTFVELASNGYVVCSIDHPYHSLVTRGADDKLVIADRGFIQEVMDANKGVYDQKAELALNQKWMTIRVADLNFVLDTIIQQATPAEADGVYHLIDTDKIGLIGHSLGGATAVQVSRQRQDIDAVINLDSDLLGEYLDIVDGRPVINQTLYPIPILSIYSDDMLRLFAAATDPGFVIPWKRILATAPHAYEVYIAGSNHMSLTDVPLIMPFLVKLPLFNPKGFVHEHEADKYYIIETMNALTLEFFDATLKGKGSFTTAGTY